MYYNYDIKQEKKIILMIPFYGNTDMIPISIDLFKNIEKEKSNGNK